MRKYFILGSFELIFGKLIDLILSLLLVKWLSSGVYGLYATAMSAANVLLVFSIPIEGNLFRYYYQYKDAGILNEQLVVLRTIWALRGFIIVGLLFLLPAQFVMIPSIFLAFAFAIRWLSQGAELAKLCQRMEHNSGLILRYETILKIVVLLLYGLFYFSVNPLVLFTSLFILQAISTLTWQLQMHRYYRLRYIYFHKKIYVEMLQSFYRFSFWHHVCGAISGLLYSLDPLVLRWFEVSSDRIGEYSVVLLVVNYTFLLPQVAQYLLVPIFAAQDASPEQAAENFSGSLVVFFFLSLGQLAILTVFGGFLLRVLLSAHVAEYYTLHFLVMLCGAAALNCLRPVTSFLIARANWRSLALFYFVPLLLVSLGIYGGLTRTFGLLGTALSTMLIYGLHALGQVVMIFIYARPEERPNIKIGLKWFFQFLRNGFDMIRLKLAS